MNRVFAPEDETELAVLLLAASAPFELRGSGAKSGLGGPIDAAQVISLEKFHGVKLYEPEELVMEVGAATPLPVIMDLLQRNRQRLAFDPPNYSSLLGSQSAGTIGGIVACNLSGSRRITAGAVRDHILGVRGVTGRGDVFKAGGRVVKNVTGYDLAKLVTGSYGTLAALTTVTLKTLPLPETEQSLIIQTNSVHFAGRIMRQAMQSPFDVSCAAYVPEEGVGLRLEGIAVSVTSRMASLIKLLNLKADVIDEDNSREFWRFARDCGHYTNHDDNLLWKISVPPSDGPGIAEAISRQVGGRYILDWSGGLIWMIVPNSDDAHANVVRGHISSGHAMLVAAPDSVRKKIDVFHSQPAVLSALALRVKHAFDPKGLLNPHRMSKAY